MRHGTTSLFAALDIATGTVDRPALPPPPPPGVPGVPNQVDQGRPRRLDVHLVWTTTPPTSTPPCKAWLARNPRFHLHFTPTGSSWLNLVERWFAELTDRTPPRRPPQRHRTSKPTSAPGSTMERRPQAFVWTKTADQILANNPRRRLRTN